MVGWNMIWKMRDREKGKKRADLSGLSALKRRTIFPNGRTMNVSRLIGIVGNVSLFT